MFKRRTLFILGAGSSAEVGLPLGKELAAVIGKKMDIVFDDGFNPIGHGDFPLFGQITAPRRNESQAYQTAAWRIRDGVRFSQSIDDFLDQHRNNTHVNRYGKAAIVKAVIEAERGSKLYFDVYKGEAFDPTRFADTWFMKFMHMLGRGVPKEDVRQIFDNVAFIVFDYDRCLEYFLTNALQMNYGIKAEEAESTVADLRIIHPYGLVHQVSFGFDKADYFRAADDIKTYTEQVAATDVIAQLTAEVERADAIVFLGFAFHSQNLLMLKPRKPMKPKFVYGTAYKMSDADVEVVSEQIASFFVPIDSRTRARIRLENKLTSADLFDHYAKSLTGGD
jgi:hypothetical protein